MQKLLLKLTIIMIMVITEVSIFLEIESRAVTLANR